MLFLIIRKIISINDNHIHISFKSYKDFIERVFSFFVFYVRIENNTNYKYYIFYYKRRIINDRG